MDVQKSNEFYMKACEFWEFLRYSFDRDEEEWERGIYIILDDLNAAVKHNPGNVDALCMRVEMISDHLGAYEEALEEAEKLVKIAPDNAQYIKLRDRIRQHANAIE
jgi:tetratricopeptide (TPR) repeat protein